MIQSKRDLVALKSELICYGASASPQVLDHLRRTYRLEKGFIHGTVLLVDGVEPVNTSFVDQQLVDSKAVVVKLGSHGALIEYRGRTFHVEPLSLGDIGAQRLGQGVIADYFSLHSPRTLFSAPVRQCIYITMGKPCTFCTFEGGKIQRLPETDFESGLRSVLQSYPIESVALGGGTPSLADSGAKYYGALAGIAKRYELGVSVELVPPPNKSDLQGLISQGADSIIMSLEIWDDDIRREICLGKGEISKERYFESWRTARESLGSDSVASVLMVGLEPIESTIAGIEALVRQHRVVPTLIPFRQYEATRLSGPSQVDPEDYGKVAQHCATLLVEENLNPRLQVGCTTCGGCSTEVVLTESRVALGGDIRMGRENEH